MSDELRERVARAISAECRCAMGCRGAIDHYTEADAAIALIWNEAMEEAAKVAVGPVYRTSPKTGEPALHGTDAGNWSVPMPLAGYIGSDYGTGRYDAAAAIRARKKP